MSRGARRVGPRDDRFRHRRPAEATGLPGAPPAAPADSAVFVLCLETENRLLSRLLTGQGSALSMGGEIVPMRVGVTLWGFAVGVRTAVDLAVLAEDRGFDSVLMVEGVFCNDAVTTV